MDDIRQIHIKLTHSFLSFSCEGEPVSASIYHAIVSFISNAPKKKGEKKMHRHNNGTNHLIAEQVTGICHYLI